MQASRVEAIRSFFGKCPFLKDGALNIDYSGEKPIHYSIDTMPVADPVVRKYSDGGTLRQQAFAFTSTEFYSEDIIDQINACGFYEQLEEWIEIQSKKGNLPSIKGIQSMEVLSPGYLFDAEQGIARYQIQCRILYLKEI